jgi:hypothetical protein
MYRSCIFCSAALGSNDSIEHFPVGRTLAFDGGKGRLWAVCPRCARWNLAPIEERWEAIEEAEKGFRDTRLRAQSENIGLAKLRDGTRLIRVGAALPGELAVWRYGESLVQRRRRAMMLTYAGAAGFFGIAAAGWFTGGLAAVAVGNAHHAVSFLHRKWSESRVVARLSPNETIEGLPARILRRHVANAELSAPGGNDLRLTLRRAHDEMQPDGAGFLYRQRDVVLEGAPARRVLSRCLPIVNVEGVHRAHVHAVVEAIGRERDAGEYLRRIAAAGYVLGNGRWPTLESLGLEMALHEEQERRAMDGELAELEAMWREAEEIAAIADALPGALEKEVR